MNLKAGTITRKRSKTRKHQTTPEVTYHLWMPLVKLLKDQCHTREKHVLTNEQDLALVREELRDNGKLHRVDNIRTAYRRLVVKVNKAAQLTADKAGADAPNPIDEQFKLLRATSSNLIAGEFDEAVADLWLAHAPTGVIQRHYVAPPQERLNKAVTWLGRTYAIIK